MLSALFSIPLRSYMLNAVDYIVEEPQAELTVPNWPSDIIPGTHYEVSLTALLKLGL